MPRLPNIASLLPSTTEIVCSLGLDSQLVAISHECDYPKHIQHIQPITSSIIPSGLSQREIDSFVANAMRQGESLYQVDISRLIALQPDIILTQGLCDVCAVTPEVVQTSLRGVQCEIPATTQLLSMTGTSFSGVCEDIMRLATATGRQETGKQLIAEAKERWSTLPQPNIASEVLLLEWIDPFFSAGHWVPQQIEAAGGTSAIGSPSEHSRRLSFAEVVAADPQFVAVVCCGFGLADNVAFARQLYHQPQLQNMTAIREQQVWAFDANSYFSRPTLRIVRGAELLSDMLKGESQEGESVRVRRDAEG